MLSKLFSQHAKMMTIYCTILLVYHSFRLVTYLLNSLCLDWSH